MNKLVVASTLLAAGALALAGASAAWPPMRRYLLCAYFVGSANLFDVNFVSHEQYRGWVRGFEIGSQDVLVFALLVSVLAGTARHPLRLLPALALPILVWLAFSVLSAVTAEVPLYASFGLLKLAQEHELLLTVEDNSRMGGAGSAVIETLARLMPGTAPQVITLGLPDTFLAHASREELLAECQLTRDGIVAVARVAMAGGTSRLPEPAVPVNILVK